MSKRTGFDFIKVGPKVQIVEIALSIWALHLRPTFGKLLTDTKVWCKDVGCKKSLWNWPHVNHQTVAWLPFFFFFFLKVGPDQSSFICISIIITHYINKLYLMYGVLQSFLVSCLNTPYFNGIRSTPCSGLEFTKWKASAFTDQATMAELFYLLQSFLQNI